MGSRQPPSAFALVASSEPLESRQSRLYGLPAPGIHIELLLISLQFSTFAVSRGHPSRPMLLNSGYQWVAFTMAGPTERLKITTFNFQATLRREVWPRRSGCLPMWCMLCMYCVPMAPPPPRFCASTRHFAWAKFGSTLCGLWGLLRTPSLFSTTRLCPQTVYVPGEPRACLVRRKRTGNRLEDAGLSELSQRYLWTSCRVICRPGRLVCLVALSGDDS